MTYVNYNNGYSLNSFNAFIQSLTSHEQIHSLNTIHVQMVRQLRCSLIKDIVYLMRACLKWQLSVFLLQYIPE